MQYTTIPPSLLCRRFAAPACLLYLQVVVWMSYGRSLLSLGPVSDQTHGQRGPHLGPTQTANLEAMETTMQVAAFKCSDQFMQCVAVHVQCLWNGQHLKLYLELTDGLKLLSTQKASKIPGPQRVHRNIIIFVTLLECASDIHSEQQAFFYAHALKWSLSCWLQIVLKCPTPSLFSLNTNEKWAHGPWCSRSRKTFEQKEGHPTKAGGNNTHVTPHEEERDHWVKKPCNPWNKNLSIYRTMDGSPSQNPGP